MLTDRDFTVKQEQHQAQLEQAERMRLIKELSQTEGGSTLLQKLRHLVQRSGEDLTGFRRHLQEKAS